MITLSCLSKFFCTVVQILEIAQINQIVQEEERQIVLKVLRNCIFIVCILYKQRLSAKGIRRLMMDSYNWA